MGTLVLAADAAAKTTTKSSGSSSFLIIIVVLALLMFFMFRSQKRRQQQTQSTQRQVVNGSRIRTVHGIFGTVVDGDDKNVLVEVAPGVEIKMLRQAIATVVPDDEPDGLQPTFDDEAEADGDDVADDVEPDEAGDADEAADLDQPSDVSS